MRFLAGGKVCPCKQYNNPIPGCSGPFIVEQEGGLERPLAVVACVLLTPPSMVASTVVGLYLVAGHGLQETPQRRAARRIEAASSCSLSAPRLPSY